MAFGLIAAALGGSVLAGIGNVIASHQQSRALDKAQRRELEFRQETFRRQMQFIERQYRQAQEILSPFIQRQNEAQRRFFDTLRAGTDPVTGAFRDPNLDPTRFGAATGRESELGQLAATERLAGATPEEDLAIRQARDRQLAPGLLADDERFRFAQDTAITGPTFEESPGYRFRVEEAERATDRALSRGGGLFGGRALQELERRRSGLAAQEFDAYARRRQADLARQDVAAGAFQQRQAVDVAREDAALQSFFGRRATDIGREERAVLRNQDLRIRDQERQDRSFYSFLQNLMGAAGGFGGQPGAQAAGTAQSFGGAGGAAFGNFLQGVGQSLHQYGIGQTNLAGVGAAAPFQAGGQGLFDLATLLAFAGAGGGT